MGTHLRARFAMQVFDQGAPTQFELTSAIIRSLFSDLASCKTANKDIYEKLDNLTNRVESLLSEIASCKTTTEDLDEKLDNLPSRVDDLDRKLREASILGALDSLTRQTPSIYDDAKRAYSIRQLFRQYDGPQVRVRRENDNEERDLYFDRDGHMIDENAFTSWAGDANVYVANWYDQSTAKRHAEETDANNQPQLAQQDGTIRLMSPDFVDTLASKLKLYARAISVHIHMKGRWGILFNGMNERLSLPEINVMSVWVQYYKQGGYYATLMGRSGADKSLRMAGHGDQNDWIKADVGEWSMDDGVLNRNDAAPKATAGKWETFTGNRYAPWAYSMNEIGKGSWNGGFRGLQGYLFELILYDLKDSLKDKHLSLFSLRN